RAQAKRRGQKPAGPAVKQKREVVIPEAITVQELANRMAEKGTTVIKALMKLGVMATINETLDQDTAELVVAELGHEPKRVSESDVELVLQSEEDRPEDLKPRPPVVTVMGHVDHGKTSLLDALRETDVAGREAGGITQHIGAYQVEVSGGQKITFLDTPGHEAFTQMRARGASVTDIVVLVVAADDGIMPQTVEAINHAKAANVPLIVAINKIDKPGADPNRIRQELLQHDVQVEEMGGDVLDVEVSALKRIGLDKLVEAIVLQAELLDLKANPDRPAEGVVIEAKLEKGRGPVATILVRRGTLHVGDVFVGGAQWGRVRAMVDERGRRLTSAGPSQPVEILGFQGTPSAGDDFAVVDDETKAREIAEYRQEQQRRRKIQAGPKSIEGLFTKLKEQQATEFPVIVKADVQGSAEAIAQALAKIGNDEIRAKLLHVAVGGITETDVSLAQASDAMIIGFNVRANKQAREAAEREGVVIKYYSVIYDLIDDVKAAMAGRLGPAIEETVLGRASVRAVFQAGKSGKAAGCFVEEGVIRKSAHARILRDDVIVYDGRISSLRRFKDDVEEVRSGTECGITFENFADMKPGDIVEAYETREVERKL
ncbi:MAG: translation initiation factor IF-2, partial [Alphaproteobacteria bacterium]